MSEASDQKEKKSDRKHRQKDGRVEKKSKERRQKSEGGDDRRTNKKKFPVKKSTEEGDAGFKKKRVRVTCLLCKRTGHRVADCRKAKKIDTELKDGRRVLSDRARRRQNAKRAREEAEAGEQDDPDKDKDNADADAGDKQKATKRGRTTGGLAGLCFNCGSVKHNRQNCDQPLQSDGAAFAICYICKQPGHLSSKCPENDHGLYPRGGGCRICGEKDHFAVDCPIKQQKRLEAEQRAKNRPPRYVASLATSDPNTFEPAVNAPVEHDGRTKKFDKRNKKNTYKTTYQWGTKEADADPAESSASSSQPRPRPSKRPAQQARLVQF